MKLNTAEAVPSVMGLNPPVATTAVSAPDQGTGVIQTHRAENGFYLSLALLPAALLSAPSLT